MSPFNNGIGHLAWVQLWQVSLVAAGVGLTTRVFCRKRPHLAYVLWILVLVKSLTPPIWTSPTGVFSWLAAAFAPATAHENASGEFAGQDAIALLYGPRPGRSATGELTAGAAGVQSAEVPPPRRESASAAGSASPESFVISTIALVWLAGAAVCAALTLISTVRLRRTIHRSQTSVDPALANLTTTLQESLRVRRPVRLVVVPEYLGPLAFGCVRPTVVLPHALVSSRSREELEPLVAHELVHVRRHDALVALFQTVAQCLWWFHPLLWWANRRIVEERERCCDEAVLAGLGWQPGRYARSLLAVLEWKWQARWLAAVPGIRAFEVNQRRLEHLMRHPGRFRDATPRGYWLLLLAGLLLVVPGAGPARSAGDSAVSTRQAPPEADRRDQHSTVENPDQVPPSPPAAPDSRVEGAAVVEAKEAPQGPLIEIYAMNADGTNARKVAAVPNFPIINSPEISPDGKWVAVDGWRWDQKLTDAHLLIVNLETGLVKDLGLGAMPTWSLDGKWIAYSKYGADGGVFLREVDGDGVRLIDRKGWGIQWSPDGFKLAYTRGVNVVVYDLVADLYKDLFPPEDQPYSYLYWNCTWSPDSKRICFKGRNRNGNDEFAIISATGDAPNLRVRCDGENFDPDIGWHRESLRVTIPRKVKPGQPAQVFEFDPDGDKPPVPVVGQPADRNNAGNCWSRDGKTLIFVSWK